MSINLRKKLNVFYRFPATFTFVLWVVLFAAFLLLSLIFSLMHGYSGSSQHPNYFLYAAFFLIFVGIPATLTIENIVFLIISPCNRDEQNGIFRWEIAAMAIGGFYTYCFSEFVTLTFDAWDVQLYNGQLHSPLAPAYFPTIVAFLLVAAIGYVALQVVSLKKMPPLVAVFCIAGVYIGISVCILLCVQLLGDSSRLSFDIVLLSLLPMNLIIIGIRAVKHAVTQSIPAQTDEGEKLRWFSAVLRRSSNWPWLAFIAAAPLLGIIVCVLTLFGQQPDSIIKVWTETADWTMSQKIAPQNIYQDEHYLCTVAAGGHRRVVKPLRVGRRHGHRVVVNRQLCVANAFEQLLEEHTPRFHKAVRSFYDKTGYPIAKHIKSKYAADMIYFIMKPLEWIFLIVLYLFDVHPENRIAVQYPHSKPPTVD